MASIVGFSIVVLVSLFLSFQFGDGVTIIALLTLIGVTFAKAAIKKAGKYVAKSIVKKIWKRCCEDEVDAWIRSVVVLYRNSWLVLKITAWSCGAGVVVFLASFIYFRRDSHDLGGWLLRWVDSHLADLIVASAAASFDRVFPLIESVSEQAARKLKSIHRHLFLTTLRRLKKRRGKMSDLLRLVMVKQMKNRQGVQALSQKKGETPPADLRSAA